MLRVDRHDVVVVARRIAAWLPESLAMELRAPERGEVGEQRELNLAQCLVLLTVGDLTARDAPHSLRDRRQGLLEQFRRLLEAAPELLGREHQDLARLERYDHPCAAPAP